jgi:hypothetical protein
MTNANALGLLLLALLLAWGSAKAAAAAARQLGISPALMSAGVGALAQRLA